MAVVAYASLWVPFSNVLVKKSHEVVDGFAFKLPLLRIVVVMGSAALG